MDAGIQVDGGRGIQFFPENAQDFFDVLFPEGLDLFMERVGGRRGLFHDETSGLSRPPSRQYSTSPEIGAEKNPAVEKKEAMANFSQRHIEKSQYSQGEENGCCCSYPGGEKSGKDKTVNEKVGDIIIRTTDVSHLGLDDSLEQQGRAREEPNGQEKPKNRDARCRKLDSCGQEKDR
jgi:hypothetical protein